MCGVLHERSPADQHPRCPIRQAAPSVDLDLMTASREDLISVLRDVQAGTVHGADGLRK
jgi:hypothetical protein